jgi:hypothetical protein
MRILIILWLAVLVGAAGEVAVEQVPLPPMEEVAAFANAVGKGDPTVVRQPMGKFVWFGGCLGIIGSRCQSADGKLAALLISLTNPQPPSTGVEWKYRLDTDPAMADRDVIMRAIRGARLVFTDDKATWPRRLAYRETLDVVVIIDP